MAGEPISAFCDASLLDGQPLENAAQVLAAALASPTPLPET
jgi:hypothetical protein